MKFTRNDNDSDRIEYHYGDATLYLARDEWGMIWFEGVDSLEIVKEYDLLVFIEMLNAVLRDKQTIGESK